MRHISPLLTCLKALYIPASLSDLVNSFIRNRKISTQILSVFLNNIYLDVMNLIWLPRCEHMIQKELHLGITPRSKKRRCPPNTRRITNRHPTRVSEPDYDALRNSIYFGGDWLGFHHEGNFVLANFCVFGSLLVPSGRAILPENFV